MENNPKPHKIRNKPLSPEQLNCGDDNDESHGQHCDACNMCCVLQGCAPAAFTEISNCNRPPPWEESSTIPTFMRRGETADSRRSLFSLTQLNQSEPTFNSRDSPWTKYRPEPGGKSQTWFCGQKLTWEVENASLIGLAPYRTQSSFPQSSHNVQHI